MFTMTPGTKINTATKASEFTGMTLAEQMYPSLQMSQYSNLAQNMSIKLALGESSVDFLGDSAIALLNPQAINTVLGDKEVTLFTLPDVSWVIMGCPVLHHKDVASGEVWPATGYKRDAGVITAARAAIALLVGGKLVLKDDGTVQMFTVKLESNRTQIIGNPDADRNYGCDYNDGLPTFHALNAHVGQSIGQSKGWWTHAVGASVKAKGIARVSKVKSASRVTATYYLSGDITPLSEEQQSLIDDWMATDEYRDYITDPFGLNRDKVGKPLADQPSEAIANTKPSFFTTAPKYVDGPPDEIPF